MASLKDQLLRQGLASQKQARQADHARRQQARGKSDEPSAAELAQQARVEQIARDREANRQRQALEAEKALRAQVLQLIDAHRIDRQGGDQPWQFVLERKVKKLYVTKSQHEQLSRGQIAVVQPAPDRFELVPTVVANRIRARLPTAVICLVERAADAVAADDPYADYPIPDDLMW